MSFSVSARTNRSRVRTWGEDEIAVLVDVAGQHTVAEQGHVDEGGDVPLDEAVADRI